MAEVEDRPMLGALELLMGGDRLFGVNPKQRLPALLAANRKNENGVSTRLAEYVLAVLEERHRQCGGSGPGAAGHRCR